VPPGVARARGVPGARGEQCHVREPQFCIRAGCELAERRLIKAAPCRRPNAYGGEQARRSRRCTPGRACQISARRLPTVFSRGGDGSCRLRSERASSCQQRASARSGRPGRSNSPWGHASVACCAKRVEEYLTLFCRWAGSAVSGACRGADKSESALSSSEFEWLALACAFAPRVCAERRCDSCTTSPINAKLEDPWSAARKLNSFPRLKFLSFAAAVGSRGSREILWSGRADQGRPRNKRQLIASYCRAVFFRHVRLRPEVQRAFEIDPQCPFTLCVARGFLSVRQQSRRARPASRAVREQQNDRVRAGWAAAPLGRSECARSSSSVATAAHHADARGTPPRHDSSVAAEHVLAFCSLSAGHCSRSVAYDMLWGPAAQRPLADWARSKPDCSSGTGIPAPGPNPLERCFRAARARRRGPGRFQGMEVCCGCRWPSQNPRRMALGSIRAEIRAFDWDVRPQRRRRRYASLSRCPAAAHCSAPRRNARSG